MLSRFIALVVASAAAFLLAALLLWNAPPGEAAINAINSPDTGGPAPVWGAADTELRPLA